MGRHSGAVGVKVSSGAGQRTAMGHASSAERQLRPAVPALPGP